MRSRRISGRPRAHGATPAARPATVRATADLTMTDRPRTTNADHPSRPPAGPGGAGRVLLSASAATSGEPRHLAMRGAVPRRSFLVAPPALFSTEQPTLRPPRPPARPALVAQCVSRPTAEPDRDRREA